jgi:hypothetical protein
LYTLRYVVLSAAEQRDHKGRAKIDHAHCTQLLFNRELSSNYNVVQSIIRILYQKVVVRKS